VNRTTREFPKVSVTIVIHNSDRELRACLRSIRDVIHDGLAELIVVDNASPDGSLAIVSEEVPEASIIRSPVNEGFARGCNRAWSQVHGQYWLLLNPDVKVPSAGIERLLSWMDAHPQIAAASPELLDESGNTQSAARRFPTVGRTLLELTRLHRLLSPERREEMFLGPYRRQLADHLDADWIPGTAFCIRREVVEAVGPVPDAAFMYGEDMEWCWRIRNSGRRIGVCGAVAFHHIGAASARRTWTEREHSRRVWAATYRSYSRMLGAGRARILLATNLLSLAAEAVHPFRLADSRQRARQDVRIHWELLREGFLSEPDRPTPLSRNH
jgi:GT2 family glycosyltransferase